MRLAWLVMLGCSSSAPTDEAKPHAGGKVEILEAPAAGALEAYVASEVKRGNADHVPVLVYVGATWCEPCRELHAAATAGTLDAELGPLRLLEFDLDRDGAWLEGAGYKSALVPLIALPTPDGRASGKQVAGVKTGRSYVEQLTRGIATLLP